VSPWCADEILWNLHGDDHPVRCERRGEAAGRTGAPGRVVPAGSQIYVDDGIGAAGEAGDIAASGAEWRHVKKLAMSLIEPPDFTRPAFLKTVACAAWDLAACRTAQRALGTIAR